MKRKNFRDFLFYFASANFLLGAKFWLIEKFGNQIPFWDQWDEEGGRLYEPFLKGTLGLSYFFSPHNEHRMMATRLLDLGELCLNGIWNPLLQMVVGAFLHVAAILVLVALLARVAGREYLPAVLAFSVLLFALPNGWENTLWGFQSQVYFAMLFSIISLWWTTLPEPFSLKWCCGFFCMALAFFSMASGVFAAAAAAALGFAFYLMGLRRTPRQLAAVLMLAALFILEIQLTRGVAGPNELKAHSAFQFLAAFYHTLAWPMPHKVLGMLQNLPILAFAVWMFKRKPSTDDPKWFLASLMLCMLGVQAGLAYGRALCPVSSRYLDQFAIMILATFACFLLMLKEGSPEWKRRLFPLLALWVLMVSACLQIYNARPSWKEIKDWKNIKIIEEVNVRNYVASGDKGCLQDKGEYGIPYPSAGALASFLDSPEIRKILPADIAPPGRPVKEGRFDGFVDAILAHYSLFLALGLLSAVVGAGMSLRLNRNEE